MATKEIARNENFENSSEKDHLRKKFCTAVQFLLNCFKNIHHSEVTKSICFVLEDVRTFVLGMNSTSRIEAFSKVPITTMDELGYMRNKAFTRLDFNIVTREEMFLLFVVHHLSLNGKSPFEEVVKDLRNRTPPVISMILPCASVAEEMGYFRKYPQYIRVDDAGHLGLPSTFHSTFDESQSSFKEYRCPRHERKTHRGFDTTVEAEANQNIKYASFEKNKLSSSDACTAFSGFNCINVEANCSTRKQQRVSTTNSTVLSEKEFISKRIRFSVLYLQKIFKLKTNKKCMCVILQVLEDVEIYFSYSSCADKVDLIQNSFVSSISKDSQPVFPNYSSSAQEVSLLTQQEQELLYFCYSIIFGDKLHYSKLFDAFFAHNKSTQNVITSDSEKLSYFNKFSHLFFIDKKGIVISCTLPDLHLHSSFFLYIFKSYSTVTSISRDWKTTNETLQSQDISFKDNLIYKRLCSFVYFLLHSFGTQPCDCLMKCISYVFPDIGIFLDELSIEEKQELFLSIPYTILKFDTCLQLTTVYTFDTTYASQFKLRDLHIVYNLALSGGTEGMKLIKDLYKSVPQVKFPNFASAKDSRWYKYFKSSKFWACTSRSYLALPPSFYFPVGNLDVLSQTGNENPLLTSEFCVSQEELKALGLPEDICDILVERIVDGVAYLLNFFELNINSSFLEVVLHLIKRGSAFFKLPTSHQEAVVRKCLSVFHIDEQGNVTYTHAKGKQTSLLSINRRLALCMAYVISTKVSVHYRVAFEFYQTFIGQIERQHLVKQLEYFKNRPNIFRVCESGFVRLANITTIKFDYISIIMPVKLCDTNTLDTYVEKNEVACSDYFLRVQAEADNCQKSAESKGQNKLICSATKVPRFITDSEKAAISNLPKMDITTLNFDVPRETFTRSSPNSTSDKEPQFPKNNKTDVSINAHAIKNGSDDATNRISPQNVLCNKHGTYKKLCVSVSFLLRAFGPLSCRHLTECISHVLRDIGKILSELSYERRQELFSSFPSIRLKDGYLHLIKSYQLVIQCISKPKLRKLFVTSYLALNGKTHYMELVKKLYQLAPEVTIVAFKDASNIKWHGCFKNSLKKILNMDSHGYLTLPSSFSETVCDDQVSLSQSQSLSENIPVATDNSLGIDKELNTSTTIDLALNSISKQYEESSVSVEREKSNVLNREFPILPSNIANKSISSITEVPRHLHEDKESQSEISGLKSFVPNINKDVSQISCTEKDNKEATKAIEDDDISVFKFGADNEAFFCPDKISNLGKKSFTFKAKDITTLSTKCLDSSNLTNLNTNRNSNLDNLKNAKKHTIGDNIAPKEISPSEIQMYFNEEVKDNGDCNNSFLGNPSSNDVSFEKNASNIGKVVHQNNVPSALKATDDICTIVREGSVMLFEYFKCPFDFRLVCVILHALHEAKCPFLLLPQSEQIALVEKILASEVKDNSCNRLRLSSSETFELNTVQRDLLFISYVVGQSGKLNFSTLIEIFEKHKMDISFLDDYFHSRSPFFSLDNILDITLENFPPAKWMTERLAFVIPLLCPVLPGQSKKNLEKRVVSNDVLNQTQEIGMDDVSKYPQGTLNILSDRMYDGVSYLLRFFEVNIYFDLQHIFEILLHTARKCSIFFKLPPTQQEEVIIASFCALRIDEQGKITFSFSKKKIVKLTMIVRMTLCMSFVLRQRGPMHYQDIFKYYDKCVGRTKIMLDKDQFDYFNNRKTIFLVCDRGFVSLAKIPTIELDFVSILISRNMCIPNKVSNSDYVDTTCSDNYKKSAESNGHDKLLSIATKSLCVITDDGEAVISNFSKEDNIATIDLDLFRNTLSSSSPNLITGNELYLPKNTRTNASINYAIKNGSDDATEKVSSQDVWGIDDLTYDKVGVSVTFLLRTFGPLNCRHLTKCIYHVLPEIGPILNALSMERRQEVFSSFPSTVLEDGCLRLTSSNEFDIKYVYKSRLRNLFITSYLALNGKSHFRDLLEKLYELAPEVTIPFLTDASNSKWQLKYFKNSSYFKMVSLCYLTLPSSFYETACEDQVSLSQNQPQRKNNPLTTVIPLGIDEEFKISTKIDFTNTSKQVEESTATVEKQESNRLNSKFSVLKSDLPTKLGSSIMETPSNMHEIKEVLIPKCMKKEKLSTFNFGLSTDVLSINVPNLKDNLNVPSQYTLERPSTCISLNPNRVESDCKQKTNKSMIPNLGDKLDIAGHYTLETPSTCAPLNSNRVEPDCKETTNSSIIPNLSDNVGITGHYTLEIPSTSTSLNLDRVECCFKGPTNTSSEPQLICCKDELMFKKLCASVSFLLHSFGPLHYRQLSDCISHILVDVGLFLDSLSKKYQLQVFSNIPSTVLHDSYVRLTTLYELDTTCISKNKLRLLYTVTYLELHGKTHLMKLLDILQKSVLQLAVHKFDSKYIVYFKNKYIDLDYQNYLTLPSLFYFTACKNLFKISQTDDSLSNESNHKESNKNFDIQKDLKPLGNILPNTGLFKKRSEYQNIDMKFQSKVSILEACAFSKNNGVPQICSTERSSKEVFTFKAIGTKDRFVFKIDAKKEIAIKTVPQSEIQKWKKSKDNGGFNCSLLDIPLGNDVSFEKNASNIGNVVLQNNFPAALKSTDAICTIVREGSVMLFEYFKCPFDFRLVCVILHALHEAKRPFLLLPQSEQIALVEKILASEVKNDSCNRLKLSSSETFELNEVQRNLLFISYVVGQSGKLHFSTLIEIFEKHKMDISLLDDYFQPRSSFFSLDNVLCITLENFPPAKWMTERLAFVPLFSPILSGLSIRQSKISQIANNEAKFLGNLPDGHSEVTKILFTNMETLGKRVVLNDVMSRTRERKTDNVSKYTQHVLNVLSGRIYDGVSYLLTYFELNIFFDLQYVFDILLHVAQLCSIFFKLSSTQQEKVIIASCCALDINEQGIMTSAVPKRKLFQLTNAAKMSLCMSFVIRQKGPMHYLEVFKCYQKCVGRTKMTQHNDKLEYFKSRKNIFFVRDNGYVSLVKIPTIELDCVSILMSRRFNSNRIEACVKNKGVSDSINKTVVQNNMVVFDENKCKQSFEDIVPVSEAVCPDKPENICSVLILKDETGASEKMNLLEKEMTERVIDSILYLSHCFVMVEKIDLLDKILCVLGDVKAYFSDLTLKNRDYFIEKYFFHNYFLHSKDFKFIFCTEVLSSFCTLNDDEKILVFSVYLLSQEKALHYTKIFDKFSQYNAAVPICVRSVLKQNKFISNQKNLFSMNSDGIVRLLLASKKSKLTLDSDNKTVSSSHNIPRSDVNDDTKDKTKDHTKQLLGEVCAASKNKTLIESTHGEPAFKFYNRIKESVVYLGRTFESVSQEQVMRAFFYALDNILNLFIDESDFHNNILKEMLPLFRTRKNTFLPMNKSTVELVHLTEVEKDVLSLIYIIMQSGPMHYLKLFKRFESRGRKVESMSSTHQYLYIKEKTKYFIVDLKGDVSLNENHVCRNLNLDGFFKDMNLKASFHSAIFEAGCYNAPTHTENPRRKFQSFSGCVRKDALYGIYEMCSDILSCFKKTPCITKHSSDETDAQKPDSASEFILSTKKPVNEKANCLNAAKHDLTLNKTFHLEGIKPTNVALSSPNLKKNPMIQDDESLDRFHSNWRESETNNTTATNHCHFAQDTWFRGTCPASSSDFFEPIPLYSKNEPGDNSIQTNQNQVYQTITDLNSTQSSQYVSENWEGEPLCYYPRNSFLASAFVDRNSKASSENGDKSVLNRTVAKFNLLELQSDDESASAKTVDTDPKRIDPDCHCSVDSTKELRTRNFFTIIVGQSKIGFSIPTLTKKLLLASKEVQHYISCVYNGKILNFVHNHETFYVSPISGNVCLKK